VETNHVSGLETRFNGEVARAAARRILGDADEIVRRAVEKYESVLDHKPIGSPFVGVYDPDTIRPRPAWQATYERVKEEVCGWGLPL
jgi:hypothetical protein